MLKGGVVMPPGTEPLQIIRTLPHGHVSAVLGVIGKIGLDRLLGPQGNPKLRAFTFLNRADPRGTDNDVQQLISKGGSIAAPATSQREELETFPVLIRIPKDMLAEIDAAVQRRRPVRIARTAWILETLQERLKREQ